MKALELRKVNEKLVANQKIQVSDFPLKKSLEICIETKNYRIYRKS